MKNQPRKSSKIKRIRSIPPGKIKWAPRQLTPVQDMQGVQIQNEYSESCTWVDRQMKVDIQQQEIEQQKLEDQQLVKQQNQRLIRYMQQRGGFQNGVQGYVDYPTQNPIERKKLR